jgi:subfamily B ATP-binding cassette protein MsbA
MSGSPPTALATPRPPKIERLRALLPDLWALVWPRRWTLALGMVLILVSRVAALSAPAATKFLIDDVIAGHDATLLPRIVLAVAGATVVQALAGFVLTQVFSRSTTRLIGELRCKLQVHVTRLSLLYHDTHRSGSLGSRIMNDVQGLQTLVGTGFLGFIGSLMTALVVLAVMARVSPLMAAMTGLCMLVFGALLISGTRPIRVIAGQRSRLFAEINGRLTESLGGVRVVKTYRAEEREDAIFADGIRRFVDNQLRTVNVTSALHLAMTLLWGGVTAVVMYVGASRIITRELTLGEYLTFAMLLQFIMAPLTQMVGIGSMAMEALAGLERTRELLRERPEDQDPQRTTTIGPIEGRVVFEGVYFSYAPGRSVLEDFSFRAEPGTVTALVGPSGSGKSTTIGLMASFYTPTRGTILVDGIDLATVRLPSYRSQIGVVLQETFLFAGTIFENIAFARPGATRDEILAACRTARVDEFAEKFELGYETLVGERGVMLSGGQRQRVSIARALLADPRILILDEATSSLDSHSEALIQEALAHLLEGRTTFVIAHRLSTIRRADQILVVDAGRIVERGTHDALCARRGLYFDMVTRQHQLEADLFLAPGEGQAAPGHRPHPAAGDAEEAAGALEL